MPPLPERTGSGCSVDRHWQTSSPQVGWHDQSPTREIGHTKQQWPMVCQERVQRHTCTTNSLDTTYTCTRGTSPGLSMKALPLAMAWPSRKPNTNTRVCWGPARGVVGGEQLGVNTPPCSKAGRLTASWCHSLHICTWLHPGWPCLRKWSPLQMLFKVQIHVQVGFN